MDTFLGLPMAMQASRTGGSMPTVFNAANERAVALFLAKKIRFLEIYDVIAGAMEAHKTIADPTLGRFSRRSRRRMNGLRTDIRWENKTA